MKSAKEIIAPLNVPFFRPSITDAEIQEVADSLRSGWLTTGPKVKRFEAEFAAAVGAKHTVAVNSCTAALHLAVGALGLKRGQAVLVPSMTFAATANVLRYLDAIPILVDCEPDTLNMSLEDAARKIEDLEGGSAPDSVPPSSRIVGIIPVHVGGMMMDIDAIRLFAERAGLWVVEDAAHAFPSAWRRSQDQPWQRCGEATSKISCFSFYANKTITTGEGGMAATYDDALAERIRMMSLHGLSHNAWGRYSKGGSWDYSINAAGYKYNLTDVAASIGIHQLSRAESMRLERQTVAKRYFEELANVGEIELPPDNANRIHSWHLFPIKLRLDRLTIDRNAFMEELKTRGVGCSVHWRPLHLHPYYRDAYGWREEDLPVATSVWQRLVSLPIFPGMQEQEIEHVVRTIRSICARYARQGRRSDSRNKSGNP